MGVNVLNNTSTQEINFPAGTTIASGDLVVNTEAGNALVASNVLSIAQNNNTTAGPSAIVARTSTGSADYYGNAGAGGRPRTCQLSNGSIVTVYPGNGTNSTSQNVNVVFKTLLNGASVPKISITSNATSVQWAGVRALSSGFVVYWSQSSDIRFIIYDNDGNVTASDTLVSSTVNGATNSNYVDAKVTSNNEIVFLYSITSNGGVRFKRYNSSGVLQGSETTVEASCTLQQCCLMTDTSGGFWCYYYRNTATSAWKFARYNSSGVLQGTLTTVVTVGGSLPQGNMDNMIIRLSGGNAVMFAPTASYTSQATAYVYNSSGTFIRTIDLADAGSFSTSYVCSSAIPGICRTGTGFSILTRGTNSNAYLTVYSANGGELIGRTTTAYNFGGANANGAAQAYTIDLFDLGGAGYATLVGTNDPGGSYFLRLNCFTNSGATVGTPVSLETSTANNFGQTSSLLTSDGSFYYSTVVSVSNIRVEYGMYAVQRKSVLGVAQSSASSGSTVRVATVGTYTINASYGAGGNFDQTTASVPGGKGTVIGSTASLFGLT